MTTLTTEKLEEIQEAAPLEVTLDDRALMLIIDTRRWMEENPKRWTQKAVYARFTGKMCALGALAWKGGWIPDPNVGVYTALRASGPVAQRAETILTMASVDRNRRSLITLNDENGRRAVVKHFKYVEKHWDEYTTRYPH
jgi:hypothetical protein